MTSALTAGITCNRTSEERRCVDRRTGTFSSIPRVSLSGGTRVHGKPVAGRQAMCLFDFYFGLRIVCVREKEMVFLAKKIYKYVILAVPAVKYASAHVIREPSRKEVR